MKVLLFGATGNLGKAIAEELVKRNYKLTVVVRSSSKNKLPLSIFKDQLLVNVCNRTEVNAIPGAYDVIISALGKSVSPNDKSKCTFKEIDLDANSGILDFAVKSGVKKFIYVSAFHSEKYLHLDYFKTHHDFAQKLMSSEINYSVIKPPAIFSAFTDMIEMAKKGNLVNIGRGDKKTNPIYEGDLAEIIVDSINSFNTIIEAGGKSVYTRAQINNIIQKAVNPDKKVRTVPLGMLKLFLPLLKFLNRNAYDKFAFFTEVIQHDTVAPKRGTLTLDQYIQLKLKGAK